MPQLLLPEDRLVSHEASLTAGYTVPRQFDALSLARLLSLNDAQRRESIQRNRAPMIIYEQQTPPYRRRKRRDNAIKKEMAGESYRLGRAAWRNHYRFSILLERESISLPFLFALSIGDYRCEYICVGRSLSAP